VIVKLFKITVAVQGIYSLITALWGLIDIESFMAITGTKSDIWLVKTVSVLLVAISVTMLSQFIRPYDPFPTIVLGALTSAGLSAIEFYYSFRDVISPVYTLDGVLQILFLASWLLLVSKYKRLKSLIKSGQVA